MDDMFNGGRYRAIRLLGKGAFSEVYLTVDARGNRFACKVSEKGDLLMREADFQSKIRHPLFPGFEDAWRTGDKAWLLMEYIQGENLENIIRRDGCFSSEQTAEAGKKLAEGLLYLHERQEPLLFRDIKPSNVMVERNGSVRLLDLGCVCRAGEGSGAAGTPGFGAPEQFEPGSIQGTAADVYGLGRTLLAMAGKNCERKLRKVIDKCTMTEPEERLPDMRYAAELLSVCCEGGGRFSSVQRAVLQGRISVRKNIWDYGQKRVEFYSVP